MRVVRQLSDVKAALGDGEREFVTPFNSGCVAGVGYWDAVRKLVADDVHAEYTLWVCCGRNAAVAHDALRMGLNVRFEGSETMCAKLQAIADAQGVKFLDNAAA